MSTAFIPKQLADRGEFAKSAEPMASRYVSFGTFLLDLQRLELYKDGARVKLQGKVCEALLALLEKPGDVVTREDLRLRLWPQDQQVNYDANVNTTVNKLRQVLGDSPEHPAFVETIPRKGYSFVAKVDFSDHLQELSAKLRSNSAPAMARSDVSGKLSFLFSSAPTSTWFRAGVVALVIASIMLGAAITLLAHRGI